MRTRTRVALLGLLFLALLALVPFRPLKVRGNSMHPTLKDGDTHVLDLLYWRFNGLRRDDIVVVRHGEEKWVKRLFGMPGDRLQIAYGRGALIRYVANVTTHPNLRRQGPFLAEIEVPPGEIFVVGDNLNQSADSTNREGGQFKLRDVVGVVRQRNLSRVFPYPQR
jgi:signal peptidase I